MVYNYADEKKAIHIKKSDGTKTDLSVQDLDKTDEQVKAFMPQMFTYEIKSTGEKSKIAGYSVEKYQIIKSGFLKSGATGYAWIASGLKLPPTRLKFESDWKLILAVLPVQFGFSEGAIMKLEVTEKSMFGDGDVTVTYEVAEVKKNWYPEGFLAAE